MLFAKPILKIKSEIQKFNPVISKQALRKDLFNISCIDKPNKLFDIKNQSRHSVKVTQLK